MENSKKIISVSDINAWLYCSRKVFLNRVCGLQSIPNRNMIIGKLKHNILEHVSKNEEKIVSQIDEKFENLDIVFLYEDFIKKISESIFIDNIKQINQFMIDKEDILKKVLRDFGEDIKLRVKAIREAIEKGHLKENIWKNLDSVYISELKLESELLGLKGRVDRVIISRATNEIVPYELKSREDAIFHSDEVQLAAYAMMLEHNYNQKISRGIIEVGNNRQEIEISDERRREVLAILEQIRAIYAPNANPPPMQSNFNKCKNCEFREECMKL